MAIVTASEYWANLYRIQDENPPSLALLLPSSEKTYHIDLSSRTVKGPEFLSVSADHKSEVIYFTVNRFYDYMDLSDTVCIVKYINAKRESHYYAVPFYDIVTPNTNRNLKVLDDKGNNIGGNDSELMLFPWVIGGEAAVASGVVEYSFTFYKFDPDGIKIVYSINTLPTKSKILHGMDEDGFMPEDYEFDATQFEQIMNAINNINKQWESGLRWIRAE